jgi:phenylacetate-CoA ligase
MRKTPLESWISKRILGGSGRELTRDDIRRHQLEKLRAAITYVRERSAFYRERLSGLSGDSLQDPDDLTAFPFTTVEDLQERGARFPCVSQSQVERVVTIRNPEAGDKSRRFHFTRADLELTVDFFHHGMTTMVKAGQRVLILLAGRRPGSVGDLLATALERADVQGIVHGIVVDPALMIREIIRQEIDSLVGIPTQVLALARHDRMSKIPQGRIKSVLLVGDAVPSEVANELRRVWRCQVFTGYTPTAMGYSGGVECEAHAGYHLCEGDFHYEVVDPISGRSKAPGELGEIVITTLTRTAMPLIRYRTRDLSRFLPDVCPCSSVLKRLDNVRGRVHEMVGLKGGDWLGIGDIDEVLFPLPGVVNSFATLIRDKRVDRLELAIYAGTNGKRPTSEAVAAALQSVPAIANTVQRGFLMLEPIRFTEENRVTTCATKRAIVERQEGA